MAADNKIGSACQFFEIKDWYARMVISESVRALRTRIGESGNMSSRFAVAFDFQVFLARLDSCDEAPSLSISLPLEFRYETRITMKLKLNRIDVV